MGALHTLQGLLALGALCCPLPPVALGLGAVWKELQDTESTDAWAGAPSRRRDCLSPFGRRWQRHTEGGVVRRQRALSTRDVKQSGLAPSDEAYR